MAINGNASKASQVPKVLAANAAHSQLNCRPTGRSYARGPTAPLRVHAAHRVDGGDRVVLVHLDLDLAAVGLADVRLVGRARVDVGLDALDGAGHLLERCGLDLGGDVAGQQRLRLAVERVAALGRIEAALTRVAGPRRLRGRGGRVAGAAARGGGAGDGGATYRGGADGDDGDEL